MGSLAATHMAASEYMLDGRTCIPSDQQLDDVQHTSGYSSNAGD